MSPQARSVDPAEALLRRTRTRLAAVTLLMVTALVVLVGVTTAITAITLMRQSVDRALLLAVGDPLVLHQLFDGETEGTTSQAVLGDADTFVMLASEGGQVLAAAGALPEGLPDTTAIAASAAGRDLRDVRVGDTEIRLLTMRVASQGAEDTADEGGAATTRYLQAGMNLALQHRLQQQLLAAIAVIGALGILGAMVVTLFVTQRALAPIREAFATERRFVAAASHELQTPVVDHPRVGGDPPARASRGRRRRRVRGRHHRRDRPPGPPRGATSSRWPRPRPVPCRCTSRASTWGPGSSTWGVVGAPSPPAGAYA